MTTTRRPARDNRYAVVSPAIPAPTTQTSHTMSPGRGPVWTALSGSFQAGPVDCLDMAVSSTTAAKECDREGAKDLSDGERPVGRGVERLAREHVVPPGGGQVGGQNQG